MARLPHDASAGHSDSSTHTNATVLDANSGHSLTLPGHQYITDAQMLRDGQDLVLHPAHGNDVVIKNYFTADPAPLLTSADGGSSLTHDLVDSFVKPMGGTQYAQNGSMDDVSPVGIVKEASGEGTITHANGTVQHAAIGVPIYEGDIVETKAHGAVNITFVDKTTFAVSENAKMAIDQYVFDPSTQHGENNFSVLRGVFVFTSGLIGHADPDDVKITTPVGSIGIRGTTIMGTINPGGDSHVSVVEGAIVVSNATGETTLSQQFETVKLAGMNSAITSEGVHSADTMAQNYNVLRTVSGPLFSTFDDMGKSNQHPAQDNGTAPSPSHEAAPATGDTPAKNAVPDANTPVNKSDIAAPAATQLTLDSSKASLDSNFDNSAGLKTAVTFSNDTGIAATTTTSTLSIAPTAAPATTFIAAPSINSGTGSSLAAAPVTSAPTTILAPPTVTTASGSSTLPAFNLAVHMVSNPSLMAGITVATVTASLTTGITYNWTSPTDGNGHELFSLVPDGNGGASITITTYGGNYLTSLVNGADIAYNISASLSDGRTATTSGDVLVPADYDISLNSVITGGVAGTTYMAGASAGLFGSALTALGDYNHDGRPDYAYVTGFSTNGTLYINEALGNNYPINLTNTPFNLSDTTKLSIASAGDFNGDGKGDLLIGAAQSETGGHLNNGTAYLLTDPTGGGHGIQITGFANDGDLAGYSVAGIGDYNGDGYSDIIIGAPSGSNNGSAYVLLGHSGTTAIDISTLSSNPSLGFQLAGGSASFGTSVAGIGDYNGDGFDDFVISNPVSGQALMYYGGQAGTNTGAITISGLGTSTSNQVVALGDANGDGYKDFGIFDVNNDKFYVFNGGLHGSTGFAASSANYTFTSYTGTITNVASAGDFNGDGINDIAVAIRNGSNIDIYVVYGSQSLTGTQDPQLLNNTYTLHIDLTSSQFNLANPATDAVTVNISSAGDLNGDGYDDLLIGLPNIDTNAGTHSDDGGVLVINGSASPGSITAGLTANASFESLIGTTGADSMSNGTSAITNIRFNAGAGDDSITLFGSNGASLIDGGAGIDTLHLASSNDLRSATLSNLENISMDSSNQVLTLNLNQVFDLLHGSENNSLHIDTTGTGNQLTIDTNKSGSSMGDAGFTQQADSGNYHVYTQGAYTLYVDANILTTAANV